MMRRAEVEVGATRLDLVPRSIDHRRRAVSEPAVHLNPDQFAIGIRSGARTPARHHRRYSREVSDAKVGDPVDRLGAAFVQGEADLEDVYREHGALVYAVSRRALGDEAAAEVTQDVFLSAWRGRSQFDPARGTMAGWLIGITKRRIVDHVRREKRHVDHRADPVGHDEVGTPDVAQPGAGVELERIVDRMLVAHALKELPERTRRTIGLAYIDGLTHEQIAQHTGVPLGTIKSDIRRGLARLRDEVGSNSMEDRS